jgi:hypothetical protein
MALQAFADDSMEAGRVLVLAGYISTAEQWSNFCKEWKASEHEAAPRSLQDERN